MRLRAWQSALVLTLSAALASAPAWADFRRSYGKGLDAVAGERWDEVEARMKEALAEDGNPRPNVKLYGMVIETYVPQYYLGLAYCKRKDYDSAARYLNAPNVESVVMADGKLSGKAGAVFKECRKTQLADTGKPPAPAPQPEPVPAPPAPTPPTPAPGPSQTQTQNQQVQNQTQNQQVPAPPQPQQQQQPIKQTQPPPVPAPTPVEVVSAPPELKAALENFMQGRYGQAAGIDPARLGDNKARYHAFVIRAAARQTQAVLQGEAGRPLLTQAEADVRSAKQLQPAAKPDPTVFSPRFQQFYTQVR